MRQLSLLSWARQQRATTTVAEPPAPVVSERTAASAPVTNATAASAPAASTRAAPALTLGGMPASAAPTPTVSEPRRPRAAAELVELLSASLGRPVHVVLTDNRSTMVSHREHGGVLRVRMHRAFLDAPGEVLLALIDFLAGRRSKKSGRVLDEFIRDGISRAPRPASALRPEGRFFDLREIWSELNQTYFHGASVARITWGSASSRRYRRTIQLGCYVAEEQLIRIHPSLDQVFVPRHYVAWIIFHEMLHEVFGVEERGGRRCVHPPEFVAIEQSYPDYARCKAWEQQNLHRLLRYRAR